MKAKRAIMLSVSALAIAAPAVAGAQEPPAVAALGTGQVGVDPATPRSEASIRKAVEAAQPQALRLAIRNARTRAELLATEAGLTLGTVIRVEEYQSPYGPGPVVFSRFGANRFCGVVTRPVVRRDPATGARKVVRRVKTRQCFVPPFVSASVEVTFAATPAGG